MSRLHVPSEETAVVLPLFGRYSFWTGFANSPPYCCFDGELANLTEELESADNCGSLDLRSAETTRIVNVWFRCGSLS